MITIRPGAERGRSDFGWLDSRHTFSFGRYHDPAHLGFQSLRVINEDRVSPGGGFGTHPHENMEILTYVVDGAIEHKDSLGNGSVVRPGEVQRMTAGTGISHSEFNPSKSAPLHFLQIWILPEEQGLEPGYEQRKFPLDTRRGELLLVASRDGRGDSLTLHQDVALHAGKLGAGDRVEHRLARGRCAWLQVVRGAVALGDARLGAGDGAAISGEDRLEITATEDAEVLLFDLA